MPDSNSAKRIIGYYGEADESSRLLAAVCKVESEPSILGSTAHIMAIGRKRAQASPR